MQVHSLGPRLARCVGRPLAPDVVGARCHAFALPVEGIRHTQGS
jgi:hypothetical protein